MATPPPDPSAPRFDVFLSHNSQDKPAVRELAGALKSRGLRVWLDEEQLVPGRPWQEALERTIQTVRSAAVLIGQDGLGPWESQEMRACLSRFVSDGLPVIPVLLPDAPIQPELPLFLQGVTWVDLRGGFTDDGLDRLQWGITGTKLGATKLPTLPSAPEPIPLDPALRLYRDTLENQHKEITLAGFKTRLRVPIDLEELYVPLHAWVDQRGNGDLFVDAADAEAKLRERGSADIALIDAFNAANARKRRHLVILGEPGAGKTTHLKRLLLGCLRNGPAWLGLAPGTVPVFLPLRELGDANLPAFIETTLADTGCEAGLSQRLSRQGRLLLLFDGLDEVSDPKLRAQVARGIAETVQKKPYCVAVVTCRFAGYDEDSRLDARFLELHLRPLSQSQSEGFIRNWYQVVETGLTGPAGAAKAEEHAGHLIERLRGPDFRSAKMVEMTRNPLLLANLCLVHRDRGGILPKGRHELYDECIDVLLELWRESKNLGVSIPAATARRALQPVALWLHGEEKRRVASAAELAPVLEPVLRAEHWQEGDAHQFLKTIRDESGLLTGWGHDRYGFMHLGFQEYLAACELRRVAFEQIFQGKKDALIQLAGHYGESWWNEVILLLLAQRNPSLFQPFMAEVVKQPRFAKDGELLQTLLDEAVEKSAEPFCDLLKQAPGADPALWANQLAALRVLQTLAPDAIPALADALSRHPLPELRGLIQGRVETGSPQQTRRTVNGGVELVYIPGGRFTMGSPEGKGHDSERPAHQVIVQPFYMGRYPVTNEEYARFLKANPQAKEPALWADRRFNQANQPVVGVDWEDACRFAAWAGGRLPTEAEWEYAARAGTATEYFWGDTDTEAGDYAWHRGNSEGTTHPVGEKWPNAFGLHDMAGNVWEWVQDRWHEDYRGAPTDGSAWDSGESGPRVLRGGSWFSSAQSLRPANRLRDALRVRDRPGGFRLARTL